MTEDDIPGASLAGQNPSSLKNEELRFWLRNAVSWGFPLTLKTKPLLVKLLTEKIPDLEKTFRVLEW